MSKETLTTTTVKDVESPKIIVMDVITPDTVQEITDLESAVNPTDDRYTDTNLENSDDDYEYEEPQTRFGRLRARLGQTATLAFWGGMSKMGERYERSIAKQKAREEKYAATEDDGRFESIYKKFQRKRTQVLGVGAVSAVMAAEYSYMYYVGTHDSHVARAVEAGSNVKTLEVQHMAKETNFYIGGATDNTGDMYVAQEKAAGRFDPTDINKQANYPAQIGPFVGQETWDRSTDIAAHQAFDAYKQAKGGPFTAHGFSEGTGGAVKFAQMVAAENNGRVPDNVTIILDGGPQGEMGIGNSPYAGAASPFLKQMGIDITKDIPPGTNVIVRSYSGDMWGNGGKQNGMVLGSMIMGIPNNHKPIDVNNSVLLRREVINGVTYEEWGFKDGPQHPMSRIAHDNGLYVSPAADRFIDSVLPVTHLGEETQYAQAPEVTDSLAALVDDTIKINTGFDSQYARQIEDAIMQGDPARAQDLQSILNLQQTGDRFARMGQNPASIPTELPAAMNEIQGALNTGLDYLNNPNKVTDMIEDGARSMGINLDLSPFADMARQYTTQIAQGVPTAPQAPIHEAAPAPVQVAQYVPPAPAPVAEVAPATPAPTPAPAPSPAPIVPAIPEVAPIIQQLPPEAKPLVDVADQFIGALQSDFDLAR